MEMEREADMTSERVEMAIFDFEMATMSAAHDMAGWSERAALNEARAALVATIDAECEAARGPCGVAEKHGRLI